jgi:hypothetical protein
MMNMELMNSGGECRTIPTIGWKACQEGRRFLAPRCFQWVKKEDRGKSGTHELLAWPLLRIRCIRKRNGGK